MLYAALEDGPRRLQSRLHALGVTEGPSHLDFATALPGDPIATLAAWMSDAAGTNPLIILDTLGKVERTARGGETDYARDYRVGGELKALADSNPGSSLVAVHHTRKAVSEDFLDMVSGTQGLAGSADSIVVLRRNRTETTGCLSVTSRDAAEGEYRVELDGHRWTLVGDSLEDAAAAQQEQRATDNLSEDTTRIVEFVSHASRPVRAAEVAAGTNLAVDKVSRYLRRLADGGRIERTERGLYSPVRSVLVSEPEWGSGQPDSTDTPLELVS